MYFELQKKCYVVHTCCVERYFCAGQCHGCYFICIIIRELSPSTPPAYPVMLSYPSSPSHEHTSSKRVRDQAQHPTQSEGTSQYTQASCGVVDGQCRGREVQQCQHISDAGHAGDAGDAALRRERRRRRTLNSSSNYSKAQVSTHSSLQSSSPISSVLSYVPFSLFSSPLFYTS